MKALTQLSWTLREGTFPLEAMGLLRSAVWRGEGVPLGQEMPVLLIPGYFAGDGSLAVLTRWLRAIGYRTRRAGIGVNIACSETACEQLERLVEERYASGGQRVAIVGQSRGGVLAKTLAAARPDLVCGIVTLASPTVPRLPRSALFAGQALTAAALATGHLPGMSWACLTGTCGRRFRRAMTGPFPTDVGYVSIYSRRDGIVDWRACRDPAAEAVEVSSTHAGMVFNGCAYAEIARALAGFTDGRELRRREGPVVGRDERPDLGIDLALEA